MKSKMVVAILVVALVFVSIVTSVATASSEESSESGVFGFENSIDPQNDGDSGAQPMSGGDPKGGDNPI